MENSGPLMETQGYEEQYFGNCPTCHKTNGYVNIGRHHWFICHQHQVRWCEGSNLFSGWREETEEDWRRNWEEIKDYQSVNGPEWDPPDPFSCHIEDCEHAYGEHF